MEEQEIFNKVYLHLKKQGKPCRDAGGRCLYIDGDMRCAVGFLMTEEQALKADSVGGSAFKMMGQGLLPEHLHEHVGLLGELQDAHDQSVAVGQIWWEVVKIRLENIAFNYKLSLPEPQD